MSTVFSKLPTTVFDVMSNLARELKAINLGQGFPDHPGPLDVRQEAANAVLYGWNQYPPMMGLPELRRSISEHFERFQGFRADPDREVMVTSGATEALAAAILALVSPGDEVVLFQPMYDAYLPLVRRAGGVPKFVTLRPPNWSFTREDLDAVFSDRTKVVIFNNPLNPSAVVMERQSVESSAEYCQRFSAVAICDEVWEHIVFDDHRHVTMIGAPGMRERTVKISSAGKIFSLTGWKVGFVVAAPELMQVISKAHQFLTFTTAPNLQSAVAFGLRKDAAFFQQTRTRFQRSRDAFVDNMRAFGFDVLPSQGTYFANVDVSKTGLSDVEFTEALVRQFGVAAIPVSAFYEENVERSIVRFCFAKNEATINAALIRLEDAAKQFGVGR